MKLRGSGDILGFKQSGEKNLILLTLFTRRFIRVAENEVKRIEIEEINLSKYKMLLKLYDRADIINDLV